MMNRTLTIPLLILCLIGGGCAAKKDTAATPSTFGNKMTTASDAVAAGIMVAPFLPVIVPAVLMENHEIQSWDKKFDQLEQGMTKEEIRTILGRPRQCLPRESSQTETCGYGQQQMLATNPDKFWIEVTFDHDRSVTAVCSSPCGEKKPH